MPAYRWRDGSRLVYVLSGVMASLAGIIYVAHVGQARADAGNGYELDAVTAVVLGGTSVFGGRGTIGGTLIGLSRMAVLKNGLALAALPAELDRRADRCAAGRHHCARSDATRRHRRLPRRSKERLPVKNSQVAVLCAAILGGALLVAATNVWLVRSVTTQTPWPARDRAPSRRSGRSSR